VANLLLFDLFIRVVAYILYVCPNCSLDLDLARVMIHIDVLSSLGLISVRFAGLPWSV
jgi:hypothetical protein